MGYKSTNAGELRTTTMRPYRTSSKIVYPTKKDNQPKHTQGEWINQGYHVTTNKGEVIVSSPLAHLPADVTPLPEQMTEAEANAQRIVKAVNLLSKLEDKKKELEAGQMDGRNTEAQKNQLDLLQYFFKQSEGK